VSWVAVVASQGEHPAELAAPDDADPHQPSNGSG